MKLYRLEQEVMAHLLEGEDEVKRILRKQFSVATVIDRRMTGTGFYVDFSVPQDVERLTAPKECVIQGTGAKIPGLKYDAGFVLFVKEGVINFLEGFSYEEPWPERINKFELFKEQYNRKDA